MRPPLTGHAPTENLTDQDQHDPAIVLVLCLITALVFGRTLMFDFAPWDDDVYVHRNPDVRNVTLRGMGRAFTSLTMSHWHPVTTLSHMADAALFGMHPGAHHGTSLLLHMANTVLLFALLRSTTRSSWCSAFVAAIFALHPLHVENLVWISDRKDLLSTFFGFLALHAYLRFLVQRRKRWYMLLVILFCLAFLSKSMWVTLPAMCLLLDYWPLERLRWRSTAERSAHPARNDSTMCSATLWRLIVEKATLLLVVAIFGTLTVHTLRSTGMVEYFGRLSLRQCLGNAVASYGWYLIKVIWPTKLAAQYFHPYLPGGTPWQAWHIAGSALLLLGISVLVRSLGKPYVTMGWLWFLGLLLPVSGVLQLGKHGRADRYMYVPMIGLLIMLAWGAKEAMERLGYKATVMKYVMVTTGVLVIVACGIGSYHQAGRWKDPMTFLQYQLSVVPNDPDFNTNMGFLLARQGKDELAIRYAERALAVYPEVTPAHRLLSQIHRAQGDHELAEKHAEIAEQLTEKLRKLRSAE